MNLKKFKFIKVKNTNDTAIRLIKSNISVSGMVVAENQINGKGQYGRKWKSYKGNLFVSFFHEFSFNRLTLSKITKINCLLVKKLLSDYTKNKIVYKKPNDLLVNNKKISGILHETIFFSNKSFLITGIGINIYKNPTIKNYPTTNISEITNKIVSKTKIENKLKHLFEKNIARIYKIKNRLR